MMKKMIGAVLVLALAVVSLFGCSGAPEHFSGEWKFSKISKIEFVPNLSEDMLDTMKEAYNAEDEEGIISNILDSFISEGTFEKFYLKFDKKNTYTYDPFMDREATWVFYQTGENEGFISFYAELDVNEGNPDPVVCPEIVYEAATNTMYIVLNNYSSFMITLALTR